MKLEVTRGIECGERGYGDESGECRVRGEWDGGDESDCGSGECGIECGDGHAEETRLAGYLPNPLHPPNNTPNNQSKPIVQPLSFPSHSRSL